MNSTRSRTTRRSRSGSSPGYSLVELIIGFTAAIIILLVLFQAFQSKTQLARTQIDVADMQQAQRVIQHEMTKMIRMAGRGGLASMVDRGNGTRYTPAIVVRDNVGSNENIAVGDGNTPVVAEDTDVLTVRGVFNSPIYQLNFASPATLKLFDSGGVQITDATQAARGELLITNPSPTGVPQDLAPFCDATDYAKNGDALLLVSPIDESIYAVVEISEDTNSGCGPGQATIKFSVRGGAHTNAFRTLYNSGLGSDPTLPSGLSNVALAGLVEEYRFYVREPDPNGVQTPALAMARMIPGTETVYGDNATARTNNARLDLADNVLDLQVALGFDSSLGVPLSDQNGDGFTNEDDIVVTETNDGQDDDWLFNHTGDDPNDAPFVPPWDNDPLTGAPPMPDLYFLRLTTLARVQVPDRNYDALQIARIENRDVDPFNTLDERRFRRQLMQTTIDLRNL